MEKTVNDFYERFNNAETIDAKKQIAAEFRAFYEGLNVENKAIARKAMQPMIDEIKADFNTFDAKAEQFKTLKKVA